MDIELLSLSKPWSGEGEGNWGDQGHCSLHLLLHPWPLEGHQGACSSSELQCINTSPGGEVLGVLNLKGCWAGRLTQGYPGPLAFTLLSNMALGNGPPAFLYCHWVSSEVGQFSYPCSYTGEEECSIPSLIHL